MSKYSWEDGDPIRACGQMGKIELMPFKETVSLLVMPLNEEFQNRFNERLTGKPELTLQERQKSITDVMFRQNVHLHLHEVEELIETLQDYVAWRKNEQA